MISPEDIRHKISLDGYAIIEGVFSNEQIDSITSCVSEVNDSSSAFRRTNDLYAIRQFFKEIPEVRTLVLRHNLIEIINEVFGEAYFVVKSIYFDKPPLSNWFVSYHRDLTISVDSKAEVSGYNSWTNKQGQYAVCPPLSILEDNFTIRIHLDDTNIENGALRVRPCSHLMSDYGDLKKDCEKEVVCSIKKGGIMIMRPLLLHASSRTVSDQRRRVVHIEFSKSYLPSPLKWSEYMNPSDISLPTSGT